MINLLLVLTPISIIDSLSVMPFAVIVLAMLLSGPKPYLSSTGFLLGTSLSYFCAGILIVVGLGRLFERAQIGFIEWFNHPSAVEYILGIVIGIAMVVLGFRWMVSRRSRTKSKDVPKGMTPLQAFVMGAGATIAGLWGALPYFAAIDQILKADISSIKAIAALAYYNFFFVVLAGTLIIVRAAIGARADKVFDTVHRLITLWGKRILSTVIIILGLVMIADGIGWVLGCPLIPVGYEKPH